MMKNLQFRPIFFYFCWGFLSLTNLHSYEPKHLEGKYQCGTISAGIIPSGGGGEYWLPTLISTYGFADAVRRLYVPGTMVAPDGCFFATCYSNFNSSGPMTTLYKYWNNGTLAQTRTSGIQFWTQGPGTIDKDPKLSNDTEVLRFKNYIHNYIQLVMAQEFGSNDDFLYMGASLPPKKFGTSANETPYGSFVSTRLQRSGITMNAPAFKLYSATVYGSGVYLFTSVNFPRMPKLRNSDSYVIPNGTSNFKFFSYVYNDTTFICLYQVAQTDDDSNSYSVYYVRGNKYFQVGEEGTGTGQFSDFGTHQHITMTPRVFKIGSYLYSTFLTDGCYFRLCRQGLSELGPTYKTFVAHSYDMENHNTNQYKDTPYPFDFCLLEKDGTPCTPSSPDNTTEDTRKIWCILGFVSGGYGRMTTDLGWAEGQCNYDQTQIACALRTQFLPKNDTDNCSAVGTWVQNSIYVTDAKRGQEKTTVAGGDDDFYQIHFNSHKMVAYHSASGRNYFIFAYCYPNKKRQLYLAYAPYYVDADHNVRLLTKVLLAKNTWGESFGNLTSCSRIISMDLVGEHLWICFMNKDNTEVRYFHCLAKDLIQE